MGQSDDDSIENYSVGQLHTLCCRCWRDTACVRVRCLCPPDKRGPIGARVHSIDYDAGVVTYDAGDHVVTHNINMGAHALSVHVTPKRPTLGNEWANANIANQAAIQNALGAGRQPFRQPFRTRSSAWPMSASTTSTAT